MKKNQRSLSRKNIRRGHGRTGTSDAVSDQPTSASTVKKNRRTRGRMDSEFLDRMGEIGSEAAIPLESLQSSMSYRSRRRGLKKTSPRRWAWRKLSFLPHHVSLTLISSDAQSQGTAKKMEERDSGFSSPSKVRSFRQSLWSGYEVLNAEDSEVILLQRTSGKGDENVETYSEKRDSEPPSKKVCWCMPISIVVTVLCILSLVIDTLLAVNGIFMMRKNEGPADPKILGVFYIIISILDMVINFLALAGVLYRKGGLLLPWELSRFFVMIVILFAILKYVLKEEEERSLSFYIPIIFILLMVALVILVFSDRIVFAFIQELYKVNRSDRLVPLQWVNSPIESDVRDSFSVVRLYEAGSKETMESTLHKLKHVESQISSGEDVLKEEDKSEKQISIEAADSKAVRIE